MTKFNTIVIITVFPRMYTINTLKVLTDTDVNISRFSVTPIYAWLVIKGLMEKFNDIHTGSRVATHIPTPTHTYSISPFSFLYDSHWYREDPREGLKNGWPV